MSSKKQPNIVLIVLDTQRRDRLSLSGYHRSTSPNLDDFARRATVFENAISAGQWTIPAHTSMFTGEYPTTHQMLQVHDTLDGRFETVAKILNRHGYQTTGFCNNPLVGILNNGLKRGFDTFYNYCGAVPSVPEQSNRLPKPLDKLWEKYTQQLRKLSYPLQNAFAHSDFLFQLSMHPAFVPVWSKLANFKGHTPNSIRDVLSFLEAKQGAQKPQFVFLNVMEPHTPYAPPDNFIKKFAPYFKESREARDVIRSYNVAAYRWLLPLEEPLGDLEAAVLNDMYDVEVHYQDHLLGPLLEYLTEADDTLTIIVADHGEGIGDHDFMGHSFVAYQELVHVPLIVKFPDKSGAARRVAENVSTRRIFHTLLAAANVQPLESTFRPPVEVRRFSLARSLLGNDPEGGVVFAEAYSPSTIQAILEKRAPHLSNRFLCTANRWAAYEGAYKLVRLEGEPDELFDLAKNPQEEQNIIARHPDRAEALAGKLKTFITEAIARQPDRWQANQSVSIKNDETLRQQLRALGYIE